ncbi:HD domain-containing protein [Pseudomonas sp. CCC2.2]|uniref:HD-GYP domain-containing protein n=1 Tax=Pseudomonas sp. CCC2.2 TaxID=3048605 RepID=UPI002B23A743|nr:HD domain-containing protein [Pseudomonas sp. CCC2.2]MEB0148621.1 HD domain-containing protein [Pseudomonas sp. CCC2.2]
MHSVAVCGLMIALARQIGFSAEQVKEAGMAGLLHDVGKLAIPTSILNKLGKLSDSEFDTVLGHPEAGTEMLLGSCLRQQQVSHVLSTSVAWPSVLLHFGRNESRQVSTVHITVKRYPFFTTAEDVMMLPSIKEYRPNVTLTEGIWASL